MPDFNAGCHLANPKDIFWNTEKLVRVLGKIDGITVAYALNALADKIHYYALVCREDRALQGCNLSA
jgi:hypothetical protein